MTWRATEQEKKQYRDEGYFLREGLFLNAELEPLRDATEAVHRSVVEAVDRSECAPEGLIDGRRYQEILGSTIKWEWRDKVAEIRSMEPYHHLDPRLDSLLDDPRLWQPAGTVIDAESVSLFSDKLNFKHPRGAPFPWHQDTPYWAFECNHLDRLVSVLIYLDDATRENGCLWVIPGTHKRGTIPCYQDRGVVGRLYTDMDLLEGEEPIAIESPAGSVIWFHGDLVHGSQSNRDVVNRRALVLTYQPGGLPRWQHGDVRPVAAAV
jgi:hypothetical protein